MRPHVMHWLGRYLDAELVGMLAPSWFTCVGLAGLAALIAMIVLGRRRGIDPGAIAGIVGWAYIAAVVAGIVVPMVIGGVEELVTTGRFHLHWSGMTSFWGYLGGGVAVALVCRREGLALVRIADLAVVPLGIALVFARIGCFMAGCDYGKVSSLPWAVQFPAGSPAWRDHVRAGLISADRGASLPVHPTELYEALIGLAIIGVAIGCALYARRTRRPSAPGAQFALAAATYAIGRLAVEVLRGDAGRGIYAGLSSGQIFSLLVLLALAARTALVRRRAAAVAVAAATGLALLVAPVGRAAAQPRGGTPDAGSTASPPVSAPGADPGDAAGDPIFAPPSDPPPPDPFLPPDLPPTELPGRPLFDPTERPLFSTGAMVAAAVPINRRDRQVAGLGGASLSLGYLPGRFGLWIDVDALGNSEASHTTVLTTASFTQRPLRGLMLGVRAGIGVTSVDFKDRAFNDVLGTTFRIEAIAEWAFVRHWALWLRPIAIDTLHASALGGSITTYQVRVGLAYRFGSRRNAPRPPGPPPEPLPPVPPLPPIQFEIGAAP